MFKIELPPRHSAIINKTPTISIGFLLSIFSRSSTTGPCRSPSHPTGASFHFLQFQREGIEPVLFAIPSLLKLFLDHKQPQLHGEHIHAFSIKSSCTSDLVVSTGLADFYFKHARCDAARKLFDEIPKRDVVLFTTMISGLSQNGLANEALGIFSEMLEEGFRPNKITISSVLSACSKLVVCALGRGIHGFALRRGLLDEADVVLETSLADMYGKCGMLGNAKRVFDRMSKRNLASWNSIIGSFSLSGSFSVALELFTQMILEGWQRARSSTFVSVLDACGETMDLRKGKELHCYILKLIADLSEDERLAICNATIEMYTKAGDFDSAILVFDRMTKRNLITWTIMISGYGTYGFSQRALRAFNEMEASGVQPDGVVFLSLISSCSHGGMVDEGVELYTSMQRDYNIIPDMAHFVCMVDLYGRAGRMEEAFEFVKKMTVKPGKFIWGALLSCCRNHKNVELGEYAARKVIELDQDNVGNYVLLSRLYADANRWNDFARVRAVMKELGVKPETACSWVEVERKVYRFTVGDCSNASSKKIYDHLEMLMVNMKNSVSAPGVSSASRRTMEGETVNNLCGHTEKLALAFALIKGGDDRVIRIGKNLRVCGDCHEFFKFVTRVYNREIILKDPNRFHRFCKGLCSCQDYW